jgi:hypothetical protein
MFAGFKSRWTTPRSCGLERVDELPGNRERIVERQCAALDAIREGLAGNQLEDEREGTVRVVDAVDRRDARMIERRQQFGLALEAGDPIGIAGENLRQDFDRHLAPQLRVARAIHLAHAAGAKGVDDFITADPRAGCQHGAVPRGDRPGEMANGSAGASRCIKTASRAPELYASSMPEVAASGEDHGQPLLVGGGDHLGVAHRPARLHDRGRPGASDGIEAVAKWKERVRCGDRFRE